MHCFRATYLSGATEDMTLSQVRKVLQPPSAVMPAHKGVVRTVAATMLRLVSSVDIDEVATGTQLLQCCMPGAPPLEVTDAYLTGFSSQLTDCAPLRALDFLWLHAAVDPWRSSSAPVHDILAHTGLLAPAGDMFATLTHALALRSYPELPMTTVVVGQPPAAYIDYALCLAESMSLINCLYVPVLTITMAAPHRADWLHRMGLAGRTHVLWPTQIGSTHVWMIVGPNPGIMIRMGAYQ